MDTPVSSHFDAWYTPTLMPDEQHWAIIIRIFYAWCTALSHTDAWCSSMSCGHTALSHNNWCMMLQCNHWGKLSHNNISDAWCTALSHMIIDGWCNDIDPYYDAWCTALSHVGARIECLIEPALSHWTILSHYWCLLHSIELFWCLMLCCIEQNSLHLNWALIMRLWTVHMCELRNMALMADSISWKLCYILRKKVSWC